MGLIRATLALSVVFAHVGLNVLVGGTLAVQMFYVISGFLIAHVVSLGVYTNLRAFYLNRFLRLYPAYIVVAVLSLVALAIAKSPKFAEFGELPFGARGLLAAVNALLFGQDWIFFLKTAGTTLAIADDVFDTNPKLYRFLLVPQAWTLGVEISFYLVAPFVLIRPRLIVLLAMGSFLLKGRSLYLDFGWRDPWSYRLFPFELGWFLLGALSHRYIKPIAEAYNKRYSHIRPDIGAVIVMMSLLIMHPLMPLPQMPWINFMLLGICVVLLPFLFVYQNSSSWDRTLGDLSYPIYIVHMLVVYSMIYLQRDFGVAPEGMLFGGAATIASVVAACALLVCVIRPTEVIRARIKRNLGSTHSVPNRSLVHP